MQEHMDCVTIKTRFRPVPLHWRHAYTAPPPRGVQLVDLLTKDGGWGDSIICEARHSHSLGSTLGLDSIGMLSFRSVCINSAVSSKQSAGQHGASPVLLPVWHSLHSRSSASLQTLAGRNLNPRLEQKAIMNEEARYDFTAPGACMFTAVRTGWHAWCGLSSSSRLAGACWSAGSPEFEEVTGMDHHGTPTCGIQALCQ